MARKPYNHIIWSVYLLAHGANPNAPTLEQRDTPLHAACQAGHLGVILRLFSADICAVNAHGRTPLHVACYHGHSGVVEYLVTERGASLNVQDNDGCTPFELACREGCVSVVYYLVRFHTTTMWDRALKRKTRAFTYKSRSLALEEEFSCSYSNISSSDMPSCYRKEDPFSFSNSYSLDSGTEESYSSPYTLDSKFSYEDENEPYLSYDVSPHTPSYEDEAFALSSRYRRSLYEAEPIYY